MIVKKFDPVTAALNEDIGRGDITTEAFVQAGRQATAKIVARQRGIVAGTKTAAAVFRRVNRKIKIRIIRHDGCAVAPGQPIIELRGSARSILKAERVALNFLQHLCGIATLTRKFVEAAGNKPVQILDTRKTTPGLRLLEKAAVLAGGGTNHRFGLFDMVLVKDNHLVAGARLSSLAKTIERIRKRHPRIRIEVEADHLDQVRDLLQIANVDVILLDNMTPGEMRKAVAYRKKLRRGGAAKFEASGGVNLTNVRQIAAIGVDYISVGALTHSAPAINLSLEIKNVAS